MTQPRRSRRTPLAIGAVWALTLVLLAIALPTTRSGGPNDPLFAVVGVLAVLPAITVATILVTRLPRNAIGWLLLVGGLLFVSTGAVSGLADYGLNVHPGSVPGAIWFAWFSDLPVPVVLDVLVYVLLLFPTGRLVSPRWRVVAAGAVIAGVVVVVQTAVGPFSPGQYPPADQNPLAVTGSAADALAVVATISTIVLIGVLFLAMASLVLRTRRATGTERQQLKWFAADVAVAGPALAIALLTSGVTDGVIGVISNAAWGIGLISLGLMPVSIGIAVLRYRLYDIDRLISRTLAYGALAAFLAVAYVGSVLLLSALLAPLASENSLAVAGSTLLVAALFSPVRRRFQSVVDRRFNRAKYDAAGELASLSQRLRSEVDLDGVKAEVVATVGRTLAPASASIWLRPAVIASNPELRQSTTR